MKIVNQYDKYIIDENAIEKVLHMVNNGYGCINIDGTRVIYKDTIQTEDGDIIMVHVGDEEECETGIDYAI